jgi:hypothetical protein
MIFDAREYGHVHKRLLIHVTAAIARLLDLFFCSYTSYGSGLKQNTNNFTLYKYPLYRGQKTTNYRDP